MRRMAMALGVLVALCGAANATSVVNVDTWSVVQYDLQSQEPATWSNYVWAEPGTVRQSSNSDASILLNDGLTMSGHGAVSGTWRSMNANDGDYFGFVFNYQDRGQYYLMDWRRTDQPELEGTAFSGMSLKIVNVPNGEDPDFADLWVSDGTENVTVLRQNDIAWDPLTTYSYSLSLRQDAFTVRVFDGQGQLLESWDVDDGTYSWGKFGVYGFSQEDILYTASFSMPEPASILLLGGSVAGLIASRIRRKK